MIIRVHTDSAIVGLGETVDKIPGSKSALHRTIAPLVLGQYPLDIEGLWRFVMDNLMYHGYAGAETQALSAVEIAQAVVYLASPQSAYMTGSIILLDGGCSLFQFDS